MMVIVEGMDNSGKTTLVNQLRVKYPFSVVHSRTYRNSDPDSWMDATLEIIEASRKKDILCDRFPAITESVYGPVLRGRNVLGEHPRWVNLLQELAKVRPVIIYCRPPDMQLTNWGYREQMDGVKKHAFDLIHQYDCVMGVFKDVCRYDYTQPLTLYEVCCKIEQRCKEW